jgi:FkbM family methyltransferase
MRFPRLMLRWRRWRGYNYEPEMELLDILCDPAKTSLDVGAKYGMYTDRLLRHSRDVVAFEPNPHLAARLQETFRGHPCRVDGYALSDAPGRTRLRIPRDRRGKVWFGRATIEPLNRLAHDDLVHVDEIEVAVRTLDQTELRNLGFIKIDVEGHELAVLRGAVRTLERDHPTLLIEAKEDHHPDAVAGLRALLAAHDYQGLFLHQGRLTALDTISDPEVLRREAIFNFLFVHRSRPEVRTRLAERLQRT